MGIQTNEGHAKPTGHLGVRVVRDEQPQPAFKSLHETVTELEAEQESKHSQTEIWLGWIALAVVFLIGVAVGYFTN